MKNSVTIAILAAAVVMALMAAGCSTTRRLSDGQTLYTGVREMRIESVEAGARVPGSVAAATLAPLKVKPNNPLMPPRMRTPLPVGLWVYNSLFTDNDSGFRSWLYRTFAKSPVVLERDVQPGVRADMVRDILDNHGYFGSQASWRIFPQRNPRKARVGYSVMAARPWYFQTVRWPAVVDSLPVTGEIADLVAASSVRPGLQYNVDTLARERDRIVTALRDKGYFWFRPEYLEYTADTTRVPYGVDLRMELAPSAPAAALVPYRVGDVSLLITSSDGRGELDSLDMGGFRLTYQQPLRVRHSRIRRMMSLGTGQTATLPGINRMLDNFTRLGIFRYSNFETTPLEDLRPGDSLDVSVSAAMDIPMELTGEADVTYKSSSFTGPSLALTTSHGNLFKGGEVLSLNLVGSYEWQTGNTSQTAGATAVNSYELGVGTSLMFPRMLVPGFMGRALSYGGRTSYNIGANLLNRPKFFRMLSFNATNTYDFRTSSTVTHSFTPFRMVYNKLLDTTPEFAQAISENRIIALSFADQFIPSGSYLYSYDKRFGYLRRHRISLQVNLTSAGNAWGAIYSLLGAPRGEGAKLLMGDPFSQFFKETADLRLYLRAGQTGTLAMRFFAGAGHAYGNSRVLPYTEQFYIGGANSIRAFTIRSIGPGSYRSEESGGNLYFDRTGDMKLEMNAEMRFRISGALAGAVFLDAGNVWLLREDSARPGGEVGSKGFFRSVATGTGVGVRYDLSFIVLRGDLGIGLHLPYRTSRRGYYNIPRFRDGLGLHLAIGYPF